ncbi:hypothetical protein ER308_13180 [Egibacter rhizosphaerae]|uniref:Uncharacterized protein n=1 Tax=Egibacter rhizosphaerae TaxID=1670831 RepID=A0A411YGQ2_9ACTN|nr:hypothetical protein [Egibacter rhizosphaerae]QBI20424.1 hypothetical protein ER308_13180 [Egibacter rhizosphaerae]
MTADDPAYAPTLESPLRVLVLGSAEPSWYTADDTLRQERVVPALTACFARWQEWGADLLATFDDDLLMVGNPRSRDTSFYLLYEVDDLELVTAMLNLPRQELEGVRLDRYFRFEALLGRRFFPAE